MKKAKAVIIPTLGFDDLPNVLIEAYAHHRPVIVPFFAGFKNLVTEGKTGLFYKAGSKESVWSVITKANGKHLKKMVPYIIKESKKYGITDHYKLLISTMKNAINEK